MKVTAKGASPEVGLAVKESMTGGWFVVSNSAEQVLSEFIVIWQVALVLQAEQLPPHPIKSDPWTATAVRVTRVPAPKEAEQVSPQLIPAGLLVTVPLPEPDFVIVRV